MGGTVSKCDHREYGFAQLQVVRLEGEGQSSSSSVDALFEGLGDEMQVHLMSTYSFLQVSRAFSLRSGCHTATSFHPSLPTSTLSDALRPPPSPPSPIIPSLSTASSSMRKSRTQNEARKSLAASSSTFANASLTGRWCAAHSLPCSSQH